MTEFKVGDIDDIRCQTCSRRNQPADEEPCKWCLPNFPDYPAWKPIKEEPVNEFKVGDRVRVSNIELTNYGRSGKIELIDGPTYRLSGVGWYSRENLELIKESPMQYESTGNAISLQAIEEAGPKNCDEFQRGLERFALLAAKKCRASFYKFGFAENLEARIVMKCTAQIPGATKFLLDKGFIREKRPAFDPEKVAVSVTDGTATITYVGPSSCAPWSLATISANGLHLCNGMTSEKDFPTQGGRIKVIA